MKHHLQPPTMVTARAAARAKTVKLRDARTQTETATKTGLKTIKIAVGTKNYRVHRKLDDSLGCECGAYKFNAARVCKHIIAVAIEVGILEV